MTGDDKIGKNKTNGTAVPVAITTPDHVSDKVIEVFKNDWSGFEQGEGSKLDYYFDSYSHLSIHEEMLKDSVRTGSYQRAITQNPHLFKGKTVLDIGAGTGILSLFAARAGASKVYAIECSDIINIGKRVVADNGYSDVIEFIRGKAEDIELPVSKVDIIVSEWMGYFLLYENVLNTVIFCRDKWLEPGGLLFPDKAELFIAAIEDHDYKEEKIGYWGNIYGFKYDSVQRSVMEEPIVDTVEPTAVATTACKILDIDLKTCTSSDLDFASPFKLSMIRNDYLHAYIAWFEIVFGACHKPVRFTTSPFGKYTHWKQTVFYMHDVIIGNKDESLKGLIAVRKNEKNHRDLDIKIYYEFHGSKSNAKNCQYYKLR